MTEFLDALPAPERTFEQSDSKARALCTGTITLCSFACDVFGRFSQAPSPMVRVRRQ